MKLVKNEQGQTALEVSLLIAVFVLVIMASVPTLRESVATIFARTEQHLLQGSTDSDLNPFPLPDQPNYLWRDDLKNLDNWTAVKGSWEASDGVLRNTSVGEGRIFTPYEGDDYMVNIEIAHLLEGNGYGIWLRATDVESNNGNNINGYTFQYDPAYGRGEFIIRKWVDGKEQSPLARVSAADYAWYDPHNVQVIMQGDTFRVIIDGEQKLVAQDSSYDYGQVGLRTWSNSKTEFHGFAIEVAPLISEP
jgi:Flp pilus assembly pilin Flp